MVYIIPEKIMTTVSKQQLYSMIQHQELNEFIGKGTIDAIQGGYDWVSALGGNIPILGKAFSIGDAISAGIDVAQGQYKDAAFRGAMAGVGLIPGAGGAAKTALKIGRGVATLGKAGAQGAKAAKATKAAVRAAKKAGEGTVTAGGRVVQTGKQAKAAEKLAQADRVSKRLTSQRLQSRKIAKKTVKGPATKRAPRKVSGIKQGLALGRSFFGNQPGGGAGGGMGSNIGAGSATGYRGGTTQFKTRARQVRDELQQAA